MQEEEVILMKRLDTLRMKHKELDEMIDALGEHNTASEFELRRLKKEKLILRDQLARLEEVIYPDIIA